MDLREQKYVCTLAEYGNLTRAAERLYISQPALSIYITNLEKNLGVPLFDRNGKKFVLTYAGERYVEKARAMLQLEQEFNDEVYSIVREQAGRLRLGISQKRASFFLPAVLAEYEENWPEIDLVVRDGNLFDLNKMLKNGELDLLVLNRTPETEAMETELLFQEELLLAVPVRHPLNEKSVYDPDSRYRRLSPEVLNGETLILHTPFQSTRKIEDQILSKYQVTPGRIRVIRSTETSVQMAAEGLGITFVREGYTRNFHYPKPVRCFRIGNPAMKTSYSIVTLKGKQAIAPMERLITLFHQFS